MTDFGIATTFKKIIASTYKYCTKVTNIACVQNKGSKLSTHRSLIRTLKGGKPLNDTFATRKSARLLAESVEEQLHSGKQPLQASVL
jgi:hypothetical protein